MRQTAEGKTKKKVETESTKNKVEISVPFVQLQKIILRDMHHVTTSSKTRECLAQPQTETIAFFDSVNCMVLNLVPCFMNKRRFTTFFAQELACQDFFFFGKIGQGRAKYEPLFLLSPMATVWI